jgi:hypothetical protein
MRTNGTIYLKLSEALQGAESGFDEDGNPIAATAAWGEPIPCSIRNLSDNRKAKYEDGEYRQSSFEVLIEAQRPEQHIYAVRLERYGEELGEFKVKSVEPLFSVGRIRIIV